MTLQPLTHEPTESLSALIFALCREYAREALASRREEQPTTNERPQPKGESK